MIIRQVKYYQGLMSCVGFELLSSVCRTPEEVGGTPTDSLAMMVFTKPLIPLPLAPKARPSTSTSTSTVDVAQG